VLVVGATRLRDHRRAACHRRAARVHAFLDVELGLLIMSASCELCRQQLPKARRERGYPAYCVPDRR
jgi:hypothetical protein